MMSFIELFFCIFIAALMMNLNHGLDKIKRIFAMVRMLVNNA